MALEELTVAEHNWRSIARIEHPLLAGMPVETVQPDPKKSMPWMFATDNIKIKAHVYKPDYILDRFEKVIARIFSDAYGFSVPKNDEKEFVSQLMQDTYTYLLFHELFHPAFCPKSDDDKEKFDVALQKGISNAEPRLKPAESVTKAGNVRNAMWDLLIDTFFAYFSTQGNHDKRLRDLYRQHDETIGSTRIDTLPDGVITTFDVVELSGNAPKTNFYPITRAIYGLLFCDGEKLRSDLFSYCRKTIKLGDAEVRKVITASLEGAVKYLDDSKLRSIGIDKKRYLSCVSELYDDVGNAKGTAARAEVIRAFSEINLRTELRYLSVEGIIEPLAKYIELSKEENRGTSGNSGQQQGNNSQSSQGQGNDQSSSGQSGSKPQSGAAQVLQSMINQGTPNLDQILQGIASGQSGACVPQMSQLSAIAADAYYKMHAKDIKLKDPKLESMEKIVGNRKEYKYQHTIRMRAEDVPHLLVNGQMMEFMMETGIQTLKQISEYEYDYEVWKKVETPIKQVEYRATGIIVPDNIILTVDGSGSMASSRNFVGTRNPYDTLMHVVYGIMKPVSQAAKKMDKKVNVIGVSFSNHGNTHVSDGVEIQDFYDSAANSAKNVILSPDCGSTHHDLSAYQLAHSKCKPGKTIQIIITDGDLQTDHSQSIAEYQKILSKPDNCIVYFPIGHPQSFANEVKNLSNKKKNLIYHPISSFDDLEKQALSILVKYDK